jgi:hypothetical protein
LNFFFRFEDFWQIEEYLGGQRICGRFEDYGQIEGFPAGRRIPGRLEDFVQIGGFILRFRSTLLFEGIWQI